ncbi:hypothetical protein G5B37_11655 [Rasiella rasia]|uniref:Uncharacterized protein n=1 Tax=Rasiella rasia TaxID=2744027 RepID=A0A6G6GNQ9_9FLAO|nr:hypothetical protein [Rasiella rasia]QIE60192.1 hypothetical protein G5B37_11655 [Rasiella rasia]
MKKIIYTLAIVAFAMSFTSCKSVSAVQKEQNEIAGYTLKNKKELFQQKVLHKKIKTVVVTP